ncbi:hypothetical protein P5G51_010055 [Virgibacillus sp. 179-BFC.A HS]|uniref:Uncharacterized protein n=1 Tax=Tigheibacillus jepli TaxID=3035914 RepID=A0ABU5CHA5_9BACI|nr:hypothetical protein [Virgibacillus sp. 179-BFC.A HS]MDY0405690.1 hypothetical protein [Virgibacillus sp. 179-BFC.A HS]
MQEGVYFFWFSWIFWVLLAFFMPASKINTCMRIWTLLAIAFANLYMNVAEFGISVTFLVLFAGGFMLLSQLPNKIYHLFAALVIMIAYDSILMWEHEVPIWLIVPRPLFFTVCMLALLLVMIDEFRNRLAVIITGVCAAELFYAVMMFSYQIPYTAGSKYFWTDLPP